MRVAVLVEPGAFPPPFDQMPALLQSFADWRSRWREKMEVFAFYAGRPGGLGIFNVDDERELSQIMFEFPFTTYSTIEARPIVDGDDALRRLTE
ncbi:MAG TPA: hypothetical protein VHE80_09630, partial [Acidimicrobiales bacterium]|nr:hypothetical protein [Acidimicrobiales bacterium]